MIRAERRRLFACVAHRRVERVEAGVVGRIRHDDLVEVTYVRIADVPYVESSDRERVNKLSQVSDKYLRYFCGVEPVRT